MQLSKEMSGLLIAFAGIALVQFGFSETCSGEIVSKLGPLLGALPGLLVTGIARRSKGDIRYGIFKV